MFLPSLLLLVPTVLSASVDIWHGHQGDGTAKAAYFLDNNPSGSAIICLRIGFDGIVNDPVRTSTGGYGAIGTNLTGFPNAVDPLISQGSVTVNGNLLLTVNAGSNTVALLHIDEQDPCQLTLVGPPADTLGEFPISVTYSEQLKTACVLNGGTKAGVSCFNVDPDHGLRAAGPLRSLGSAIDETTPPTGPPGSSSEILFNPTSSAVIVSIKGSGPPGYIVAFPVEHNQVSTAGVFNQVSDIKLDFAAIFINRTSLFLVDPSFGASILEINSDYTVTEKVHTVIRNQSAVCWANYDVATNTAYAIDAGQPVVYTLDASTGVLMGNFTADSTIGGLFDSAIGGRYMYSLALVNGVVVFDIREKKQIQFLNLTGFGERQGYTGMALWP
ncbi:hypothetical protein LTR12_016799 [Friedmanniomyces endolithicus]|nr:hypothetical protein LTR12_016799 [Friedmanniomyces endolithicus]